MFIVDYMYRLEIQFYLTVSYLYDNIPVQMKTWTYQDQTSILQLDSHSVITSPPEGEGEVL